MILNKNLIMKKILLVFCLLSYSLISFSQTKKGSSAKKSTTPKSVIDCLVNSSYSASGNFYQFYSNGTGVVGKSPSFTWKYLGNNIILVRYNSDYFNDDKFRIINPGKNCDIININ